jgi:hypothetical protein
MILGLSLLIAAPVHLHGQQTAESVDHSAHHPAAPATQAEPPATGAMGSMASAARLDELVKKMNAAKGEAKTAAIAELLTVLVQDRQACAPMMANMMKMMDMMGGAHGTMPMKPAAK